MLVAFLLFCPRWGIPGVALVLAILAMAAIQLFLWIKRLLVGPMDNAPGTSHLVRFAVHPELRRFRSIRELDRPHWLVEMLGATLAVVLPGERRVFLRGGLND